MNMHIKSYQLFILLSLAITTLTSLLADQDQGRCMRWYEYIETDVGVNFNYARYKLGEIPNISGYLAGVHFESEFKKPCHALVGIYFDGRWNAGHLCSKTDLCNPSDVRSKVADYIVDLHLGYNWSVCNERYLITPFVGVGFYNLSQKLTSTSIRYSYNNIFVPIGLQFDWLVNNDFSLGLSAAYRIDARTRLKIKAPNITICEKLTLKRSHGVKVEMPMTWYYDLCFCTKVLDMNCKVMPFFDWNSFGTIDEKCDTLSISVPQLKRWYLGLRVLVGFDF